MLFSIIIPVYNSERYLEECLDSVLRQSYERWQAIIIDDGSDDGSFAIAEAYRAKDARFRVIHKENEGQIEARLDGIRAAEGEVIMFLDSDDWWEPGCLEKIAAIFEADSIDAVFFPAHVVNNQGVLLNTVGCAAAESGEIDKKYIYESVLSSHGLNSLCLKAFRKSLFDLEVLNGAAEKRVRFAEDKLMLLPLITNAKKIYYLKDALYAYRRHEESVSHKCLASNIQEMLAKPVFAEVYRYMPLWEMANERNKQKLELYYIRNLISCYYRVWRSCSGDEERKLFRQYPWKSELRNRLGLYLKNSELTIKEKIRLMVIRMTP